MAETTQTIPASIDESELERKVKDMYRDVALNPDGDYHFEMGRQLAERLGYSPDDLDLIPSESIDSFAGVGYYFHLADMNKGDNIIDFGSGSGMDTFVAALKVGVTGRVVGIDMTDEQLAKSRRLCEEAGVENITYLKGYLDDIPCGDASFDVVISNGVFNLASDKAKVFTEVARVLKPGGRLAVSDIVTKLQLPEGITCNTTLWAACIGGAMQIDEYVAAIENAGLHVSTIEDNPQYQFLTSGAQGASRDYGVKSVSLLAVKPG